MDFLDPPNLDGDDYEAHGKFYKYKHLLQKVRSNRELPEETKLRHLNLLKAQIIPFWHRRADLRERESKELLAVFLKYHGPDGIEENYTLEYEEMKSKIAAAGDTIVLSDIESYHPMVQLRKGRQSFQYGPQSRIYYDMELYPQINSSQGQRQSEPANEIEQAIASSESPIVLNQLNAAGSVPDDVHHNYNLEDDLSLKVQLLQVLHHLMKHKDARSFMKDVDESVLADYCSIVQRPRCFTFIEAQLRSGHSYEYGATAFFNDMLLVFYNCRLYSGPDSDQTACADRLERLMRRLLQEMGPVGKQLLAQYDAVVEQGPEWWPDRMWISSQRSYNKELGSNSIMRLAKEEFEHGQERVKRLRRRLAMIASGPRQGDTGPPVDGGAQPSGQSRKRPHDEVADAANDCLDHGMKRRRLLSSPTAGPSNSGRVTPRRTAAKRLRAHTDDDTGDHAEADKSHELRSSKRQRLTEDEAPIGVSSSSAGAAGSGSHNLPPAPATPKRNRAQAEEDSESDDLDGGDGRGPSGSKRRRTMKEAPYTSLAIASTQAGPSTPKQASPEPGDPELGSAQSHLTSPAGQPTPQPVQYPSHYGLPSSKPLKFSRNTVTMSKITKMGKKRPWLFGYKTAEGYGIYAFVSCPGANCKHHFSSHPLRDHRARDHILACNQPIRDDRDMIRQYARQVVKDADRKSDLTVDWARKSNLSLLPSNLKTNHPENFPISPDDE